MSDEKRHSQIIDRAINMGFAGVVMICGGILWVFLRPEGTMFGVAELLAVAGMLTVMAAAWRAAEAAGEGRDGDRRD